MQALAMGANGSDNWRVVFQFRDSEAVDVNLVDYH